MAVYLDLITKESGNPTASEDGALSVSGEAGTMAETVQGRHLTLLPVVHVCSVESQKLMRPKYWIKKGKNYGCFPCLNTRTRVGV